MNAQERKLEIVSRLSQVTQLEATVEIVLKGDKYTLEFNNYAVRGIFRTTGINLLAGFNTVKLNDPDARGAFLFWGLKTHHPELTEEAADKLQTMKAAIYITGKISEAIQPWFPDVSDIPPADDVQPEGAEVVEMRPLAGTHNGSGTGLSLET